MNLEIKLPVAFKEKWVAALRSGKFKQAKDYLKTNKGYCCLGVAVEVGGIGFENFSNKTITGSIISLHVNDVPDDVLRALDQYIILDRKVTSVQFYLTTLNDGYKDFNRIADWIDENL